MNCRISKLRNEMDNIEIDGMIVNNPINIKYLTNIEADGILLVTPRENIFITNPLYIEDVNNTITIDDEIIVYNSQNLRNEDYYTFFQNCNRVGFEENYITYANYIKMIRKFRIKEAIETEEIIEKIRICKDNDEILKIEKACNITDSCFLYLLDYIKTGMTEKQIANEIKNFFIENGADKEAFETIVACGKNTSKPHAIPTDTKIKEGDAILIDFGANYQGYNADMTRTIFMKYVSDENKALYNFILKVQERAFEKIKNGADAKAISESVKTEFYSQGYDLIHALGHGVGLEIHEKPILSYLRECTLKEDMVVTNEPGIYIPNKIGIRIEDTVLVNNMSATNLTKSNKNLLIL